MKKISFIVLILPVYLGCHHPGSKGNNKSFSDRKHADSAAQTDVPPDTGEQFPTFDEVKADLFKSYNQIKKIDTIIIDGKDSLQVHFKYYCLHDSSVTVPALYMWGNAEKKDFIANNFASKILIIKNQDTIFNRIIYKKDFNYMVNEEERKYAIMFDAGFDKYNKAKGMFVFGYTITIPLTDVGVPTSLTVDKNGKYAVHNEYYKD